MISMVCFHGNVPHIRHVRMMAVIVLLGAIGNVHRVLLVLFDVLQDFIQIVIHVGIVVVHRLDFAVMVVGHAVRIVFVADQIASGDQRAHVGVVREHVSAD